MELYIYNYISPISDIYIYNSYKYNKTTAMLGHCAGLGHEALRIRPVDVQVRPKVADFKDSTKITGGFSWICSKNLIPRSYETPPNFDPYDVEKPYVLPWFRWTGGVFCMMGLFPIIS